MVFTNFIDLHKDITYILEKNDNIVISNWRKITLFYSNINICILLLKDA